MAEKIATRVSYGQALKELGQVDDRLMVFDADLSNATMTNGFAEEYPDRFYNLGIAESNMVGAAAGMATCGKKPFVNTFAIFSAGRCWEQIRNSIAYPALNVKVIGSHGGISVGQEGATHQCIEDYALMRVIPGMTVLAPCDDYETKQAIAALLEYPHPAYLRLGRMPVAVVTKDIPHYKFEIGKGATLRDGKDITIIACGIMVQMALEAANLLAEEGISVRVVDMHTIKPLDCELVLKAAAETGCIVTAEEHNVLGGLGSAVAEVLVQHNPVPMYLHGIKDHFGRSGLADDLLTLYGLSVNDLCESVKSTLLRKSK